MIIVLTERERKKRRESLRLGGSIDSEERMRRHNQCSTGANVNDRSLSPFQHPTQNTPRYFRCSFHVHSNNLPPHTLLNFVEKHRMRIRHPHVVHQHAHIQPLDRLLQPPQPLREILAREVYHHHLHARAWMLRLDFTRNTFQLLQGSADQDEVEPSLRQLPGEGLADAVRGSGDQSPGTVGSDEVLLGSEAGSEDPGGEGEEEAERDDETEA